MSPELEEELFSRFPALFENRKHRHSPMVFGCEHGDGWHGIIRSACRAISFRQANAGRSDFRFSQVKEKWGVLRIYYSGGDEFCGRDLDGRGHVGCNVRAMRITGEDE